MSTGFNPFGGAIQKRNFERIENETGQCLFIEQLGYIRVKERIPVIEEYQAQILYFQREAAKNLADAKSLESREAIRRLEAKRIGGVVVDPEEDMYEWLTSADKKDFWKLQLDRRAKNQAALTMLKFRWAYAVVLKKAIAKGKAEVHLKQPLLFPLKEGDRLRFGEIELELADSAQPGDELLYVRKSPARVEVDEPGLLLQGNTERVGLDISSTGDMSDFQVDLLYDFYGREQLAASSRAPEDEAEEDEPEDIEETLGNSEDESTKALPTGSESGPESKEAESKTLVLN